MPKKVQDGSQSYAAAKHCKACEASGSRCCGLTGSVAACVQCSLCYGFKNPEPWCRKHAVAGAAQRARLFGLVEPGGRAESAYLVEPVVGLAQIGHQRGILFRRPGIDLGLHVIGKNGIEHRYLFIFRFVRLQDDETAPNPTSRGPRNRIETRFQGRRMNVAKSRQD